MISGFVDPWEPLFMGLNIPKCFNEYQEHYGHVFETYYVCEYDNLKFVWKWWELRVSNFLEAWKLFFGNVGMAEFLAFLKWKLGKQICNFGKTTI